MRLDKFICKSTELTRAEATHRINNGEVIVNGGVVVDASTQVHENNTIVLDGEKLTARSFRYLLIHKPLDTVCSNVDEAYPSLFNHIGVDKASELHVAGRLDADTTGLVLLTDDGRWSFDIIRPSAQCQKVYRVNLRDPIVDEIILKFEQGIQLQGEKSLTLPAKLEIVSAQEVLMTITEGKYHQVKRMFAAVGNRVLALHREKIGRVSLDVELGDWRYLTIKEVASFLN